MSVAKSIGGVAVICLCVALFADLPGMLRFIWLVAGTLLAAFAIGSGINSGGRA